MKVIGICAGFHALCNSINEGNDYTSGLNIFNTSCVPIFNDGSHNTGWLNLEFNKSKFMHKVERSNSSFYFNHAYGVISKVSDCDEIIYGKEKIRVIVKKGIWWGVQFHPECSGTNGESLFKGIVKL